MLAAVVVAGRSAGGPTRPNAPVAGGPVPTAVLVPGYGGSLGALRILAARLSAAGHRSVLVDLGDAHQPFADQAARIDTVVAPLLTGAGTIDLIGFSDGGVAARVYLAAHPGRLFQVRRVITLGSPQHGTSFAALAASAGIGCVDACAEVLPGSDLLTRLNRVETPLGPHWVTLRTARDTTVTPVDTAVLAGAVNIRLQDVCADDAAGHGDLPTDPLAVGLILRALGPGLDGVPTDCAALRAAGG